MKPILITFGFSPSTRWLQGHRATKPVVRRLIRVIRSHLRRWNLEATRELIYTVKIIVRFEEVIPSTHTLIQVRRPWQYLVHHHRIRSHGLLNISSWFHPLIMIVIYQWATLRNSPFAIKVIYHKSILNSLRVLALKSKGFVLFQVATTSAASDGRTLVGVHSGHLRLLWVGSGSTGGWRCCRCIWSTLEDDLRWLLSHMSLVNDFLRILVGQLPSRLLWVRDRRMLWVIPHSRLRLIMKISWFLHAVEASCASVASATQTLLRFWNRTMIIHNFERLALYFLKTLVVKSTLSVVIVWIQLEVDLTFCAGAYHSIATFLTWPKHLREQRSLFGLMRVLIQYLSKIPLVIFFLFICFTNT